MTDEIAEARGEDEDQGQALPELGDPAEEVPEPWDVEDDGPADEEGDPQ